MSPSSRSGVLALFAGLVSCGQDAIVTPPVTTSVEFAADTVLIPAVGFERTLEVAAIRDDGTSVPSTELVWGSRTPHVVQTTSPGVVRGVALGESLVIATSGSVADTVLVRVAQVPEIFVLTGPDTIWGASGRERLTLTKVDSAGEPVLDLPAWSSSNPSVAEGSNGSGGLPTVAANGIGSARITATLRGVSASFDVVVGQRPRNVFVSFTGNVNAVGDTATLRARVEDVTSVVIPDPTVEWFTSDSTVARFTSDGFLTAVASGTVVVGATVIPGARSGDGTWRTMLQIHPASPPPGALKVSPATYRSDGFGEEIPLRAYMDDGVAPAVLVPAVWTSRNPLVASVTPFFATTHRNGSTWLVAQYDGRVDSIALEVRRVPVVIDFQSLPREFSITFTSGTTVSPVARDRFGGLPRNPIPPIWTIRDSSVVAVNPTGLGGVGKGSTWVVAEVEGLRDSVFVTVIPRWENDFVIENEADLLKFADLGIEEVFGSLRIHGTSVTSLDGLETLRLVTGEVRISSNTALSSMDGLSNLEIVTGPILIEDNPALTVRLPRLREAGSVDVFRNLALESHSFADLTRVPGELDLGTPGPPIYFDSLIRTGSMMWQGQSPEAAHYPALETITNDLTILNTTELVTFSAPRLWRARSIDLVGNRKLSTLNVGALSTLVRDLEIVDNVALSTLDAFAPLTSGVRTLRVEGNNALISIEGLEGIGDALGSDPVVLDSCTLRDNPQLSGTVPLIALLENKFPGVGVPECTLD